MSEEALSEDRAGLCLNFYISCAQQEMFMVVFNSLHLGMTPIWVQEQSIWGWGVEKGICQALPQLSLYCLSQMIIKLQVPSPASPEETRDFKRQRGSHTFGPSPSVRWIWFVSLGWSTDCWKAFLPRMTICNSGSPPCEWWRRPSSNMPEKKISSSTNFIVTP